MTRTRILISVIPDTAGDLIFRLLWGRVAPADRAPRPFTCTPAGLPVGKPPPPPRGWVRDYGEQLWQGLLEHPEVGRELRDALRLSAGQLSSIEFQLENPLAELVNWEMLCDGNGRFLALDDRWPVVRVAAPVKDRAPRLQEFTSRLRIMAVLSALGVPTGHTRQEWNGLHEAVRAARAAGMDTELHVFVGDGNLTAEVTEAARHEPWLHAEQVTDRSYNLLAAIKHIKPHLLHFFCHGSAEVGQPRLLLATPQDFERAAAGTARSSVVLQIDDMKNQLATLGIWLVVLNCCQSGMATREVYSLANTLVDGTVPAALGMREEIQVLAANEFSRAFYSGLLTDLHDRLQAPAGESTVVELDWAAALRGPRTALVEQYQNDAATHGEWSLPVLYLRQQPAEVRVQQPPAAERLTTPPVTRPAPGEEQVAATIMAGLLERLPPDAPPEVAAELRRLAAGQTVTEPRTPPTGRGGGGLAAGQLTARLRRLVTGQGDGRLRIGQLVAKPRRLVTGQGDDG